MKKAFTVLVVFALIFLAACSAENDGTVYAYVNGEAVTSDEIDYFKLRFRSEIINEYSAKYGVTDYADFWETEYDGKTPSAALEEKAFDEAVSAKIKLILMRKNGIYADIGFASLKALAEEYNAQHANNKKTVGILTIDLESFYTYYISTGEMELKNILAEGELKPSQAEIYSVMEENDGLTEAGAAKMIVEEKYPAYIETFIGKAEIERG